MIHREKLRDDAVDSTAGADSEERAWNLITASPWNMPSWRFRGSVSMAPSPAFTMNPTRGIDRVGQQRPSPTRVEVCARAGEKLYKVGHTHEQAVTQSVRLHQPKIIREIDNPEGRAFQPGHLQDLRYTKVVPTRRWARAKGQE